jgi:hypothetical protein
MPLSIAKLNFGLPTIGSPKVGFWEPWSVRVQLGRSGFGLIASAYLPMG